MIQSKFGMCNIPWHSLIYIEEGETETCSLLLSHFILTSSPAKVR